MKRPSAEQLHELEFLRGLGFRELRREVLVAAPVQPAAQPPARLPAQALEVTESDSRSTESRSTSAPGETFEALQARAETCTACRLHETRQKVVFGSGDPAARLMFIGEGPGAEEDRQGLPFVGPAGQLLTRIIGAIGLERQQVYIANIVKCRPPNNRDPATDEVRQCIGYLESQIDWIQPEVIVLLGKVAAQTLLGIDGTLGRMRGSWHEVRGVPARVTYHPAAVLRSQSFKRPTWEDLQLVRDRLAGDSSP